MPRYTINKMKARESDASLLRELKDELQTPSSVDKADLPTIIEEINSVHSIHITVIWDKWKDVDQESRGRIIWEAFSSVYEEEKMRDITLCLGFTKEEAIKMRIDINKFGSNQ